MEKESLYTKLNEENGDLTNKVNKLGKTVIIMSIGLIIETLIIILK